MQIFLIIFLTIIGMLMIIIGLASEQKIRKYFFVIFGIFTIIAAMVFISFLPPGISHAPAIRLKFNLTTTGGSTMSRFFCKK